jgi:hypothetical protein
MKDCSLKASKERIASQAVPANVSAACQLHAYRNLIHRAKIVSNAITIVPNVYMCRSNQLLLLAGALS